MFQVNDVIIYGSQGICRITAIEEKSIGGAKRAYFVLKPIEDQGATIYAPTDHAAVLKLSGKDALMTYILERIGI